MLSTTKQQSSLRLLVQPSISDTSATRCDRVTSIRLRSIFFGRQTN